MVGLRVGLDLVAVGDVEESVRVHGTRYLGRVFTAREVADCRDRSGTLDPRRLATRFAAKEAAIKALGVRGEAVPWRCLEVVGDGGMVSVRLSDAAATLARSRGITQLAVSLTQTADHAGAVVIARDGGRL